MKEPAKSGDPKRAITLGGGGPAAGLHIGVLKALHAAGIEFEVWSLSCIGAWVGIVYNQCDKGTEVEKTYEFFRNKVFRDDESYERFPINSVFGSDLFGNSIAAMKFMSDPKSYEHLWQPHKMMDAFNETMLLLSEHSPLRREYKALDRGDINGWFLESSVGTESDGSLSDISDVSVQCYWLVPNQLSGQRIYEGHQVRQALSQR